MIEQITYKGKLIFEIERFTLKNINKTNKDGTYTVIKQQDMIGIYYYPNGYEFSTLYTNLYNAKDINI